MNSVLVVIDSKDRSSYSLSTNDFNINYPNNQILTRIKSFFVKSVTVPNVEYNIHDTYQNGGTILEPANNLLYIETFGGGLQPVITVPIGQYSLVQLINEIKNSPTGLAVGLNIVQDPVTFKLTFTSTSPGGIKIYSYVDNSTIAPNIGILQTTPIFSASIISDGLPSLAGNQNVYIGSAALASGTSLIDARFNNLQVITTIPMNQNFGDVVHYETFDYVKDTIDVNGYLNLRNIDIKLYNDYGASLDLKGEPFTMIIKAYYDP